VRRPRLAATSFTGLTTSVSNCAASSVVVVGAISNGVSAAAATATVDRVVALSLANPRLVWEVPAALFGLCLGGGGTVFSDADPSTAGVVTTTGEAWRASTGRQMSIPPVSSSKLSLESSSTAACWDGAPRAARSMVPCCSLVFGRENSPVLSESPPPMDLEAAGVLPSFF
jgi:hypothetical protein